MELSNQGSKEEPARWASVALARPVRIQYKGYFSILNGCLFVLMGGLCAGIIAANGLKPVSLLVVTLILNRLVPILVRIPVQHSARREHVSMRVGPAHGRLDDPVEAGKAGATRHAQPAPDRRIRVQEGDLDLVRRGWTNRHLAETHLSFAMLAHRLNS